MPDFDLKGIRLSVPRHVSGPKVFEAMRSGRYEQAEARCAERRIAAGDKVLEIGAGVGFVTALCAKAAGAENVTAVDAHPDLLAVVEANLAQNELEGVRLIHGAVAGEVQGGDKTITFNIGPAFWGSSLVETPANAKRQVEVPLLDIHALLEETAATVVIMDVEGAEASMFSQPWPARVHTVCIELHPARFTEGDTKRIFDRLSEIGLSYDPHVSNRDVVCLTRNRGF
ncbi:MAG: FkbM family methyltransferase [Pseudomonadota bacterium]